MLLEGPLRFISVVGPTREKACSHIPPDDRGLSRGLVGARQKVAYLPLWMPCISY